MNHREKLFDKLSQFIEDNGKEDAEYDNVKKSLDILAVLEDLLAYTIFITSETTDHVRDGAEESYINIKRRALHLKYREIEEERKS